LYLFVVEILLIIVLLLITIAKRLRSSAREAIVDVSNAATSTTHSGVTASQ